MLNLTQNYALPITSNNLPQSLLRVSGSSLQTTQQGDLPVNPQVSEIESPRAQRACLISCAPVSCAIS